MVNGNPPTNSAGAGSHIQIFKRGGRYRVRPGTFVAGRGATVIFFNAGPSAVRLIFPESIFTNPGPVPIAAGGSEPLTVKQDLPLNAYVYGAYIVDDKDFAEGESAPVIIIDR